MRLSITHRTEYEYDAPVDYALQQVRLTPPSNSQQNVLSWQVDIEGGQEELSFTDQYKNHTMMGSIIPGGTKVVVIIAGGA